jgi:hypothetical protein
MPTRLSTCSGKNAGEGGEARGETESAGASSSALGKIIHGPTKPGNICKKTSNGEPPNLCLDLGYSSQAGEILRRSGGCIVLVLMVEIALAGFGCR